MVFTQQICIFLEPVQEWGKTAWTLALARQAAMEDNKGVAFFSLEMSDVQLASRMVAIDAEISTKKLRDARKANEADMESIYSSVERFSEAPIFIDDTPGMNVNQIRSKARQLKLKHDIQLIIVDYLQLMRPTAPSMKRNRDEVIGEISRGLKEIAKELEIPVVALVQLNRSVEATSTKIPNLSHIRESGNIEQDADFVGFLYRPEYYGITEDEKGNNLPKGLTYFIVAKNRHGELGRFHMIFKAEFTQFRDFKSYDFDEDEDIISSPEVVDDDEMPF